MARKLRVEYAGAIYHLMNRGDRQEPICRDDRDRQQFLDTLGEAGGKTGWQVHALCLMPNHFHLVLETPRANLVAGMKWFLGTDTGRLNRLPVRAARRQGGTSSLGTCSADGTRAWWWTAAAAGT
jgi:REP element-mobilizing transposase RayT